ncbi:MAG: geranylgeranyl reductase family protein [Acidobacteria bacterium]|nr:MAG: geranylgeranyl reductase family protein [Acidobacteriota bacterium]
MFDADVLVAGAGPAGCLAARALALGGARVLLIDKARFPRNKPCGGGISARAVVRFPWLSDVLSKIEVNAVSDLHLRAPDGQALDMSSAQPSVLLIRRLEFDEALLKEAIRCGAEHVDRFEVTQVDTHKGGVVLRARDGRRLTAGVVVAADGVHSVIARRLGVNQAWKRSAVALDMMEETPSSTLRATMPGTLWVSYGHGDMGGYAYIFPKLRHVNVGIGCFLSDFQRQRTQHPYELQLRFVNELVAAGMLSGNSDRSHFTPFLVPVGGPLRRAHHRESGRVLFVGDAGGFVNAFTAEGIYYAMVSGELAATAALEGDFSARSGRLFDRLWKKQLGRELSDSVIVQKFLFRDKRTINGVVSAGRSLPWLSTLIVDYAAGRSSYTQARRRVLMASPRTALRLGWMLLQHGLFA